MSVCMHACGVTKGMCGVWHVYVLSGICVVKLWGYTYLWVV